MNTAPLSCMRPTLSFVDDATAQGVVDAAKDVLERIGVRIDHGEARRILQAAGAVHQPSSGTPGDDERVRIRSEAVDMALSAAPRRVTLHDRDGDNPITLGRGEPPRFNPGSAAIRVRDPDTGVLRDATRADCALFARLTEALPALALQSTCVVPHDAPIAEADSRRLYYALRYCRKPIVTGAFRGGSLPLMHALLRRVRGGAQALADAPLAIFDCCPTAPLHWSALGCDALIGCAQAMIPTCVVAVPMAGATAPATLLDTLVQHTAENLSGIVIQQCAVPGSPMLYGGAAAIFDMRMATAPMAAVETMMLAAAHSQVGRFLGLPTQCYAALSDSKLCDYQAGVETGSGALWAVLAGADLISGPGALELLNAQSPEKLVLDAETCATLQRAARGFETPQHSGEDAPPTTAALLAAGLEAGHFLKLPHTRRNFRSQQHLPATTIDRQSRDGWRASGATDSVARAHTHLQKLLADDAGSHRGANAALTRALDSLMQEGVSGAPLETHAP